MKKRLSVCTCICMIVMTIGGCQVSSKDFLVFKDTSASAGYSIDHRLTQARFFAEDLVTVTKEDNDGVDTDLSAGTNFLLNVTDKEVIYADNVYDRLYPASLTKLMTALVVLQYGELTDSVTVRYNASHIMEGGAKLCGFEEGDIITMDALLKSLLVYSGNDAAIAVANHVGGSESSFVVLMNEEAKKIGAIQTNFVNSHGLPDDNQYTTAYDIYLIFNELMKYDTFRSIISTDTYTAVYKDKEENEKEKTFKSTNAFLTGEATAPKGIIILGGKTGTTSKSRNCLVLLSKDSLGKEYLSIIMKASNSSTLYSQMSHLLSKIKTE